MQVPSGIREKYNAITAKIDICVWAVIDRLQPLYYADDDDSIPTSGGSRDTEHNNKSGGSTLGCLAYISSFRRKILFHFGFYYLPFLISLIVLIVVPENDHSSGCAKKWWNSWTCGVQGALCTNVKTDWEKVYCPGGCYRKAYMLEVYGGASVLYPKNLFRRLEGEEVGVEDDERGAESERKLKDERERGLESEQKPEDERASKQDEHKPNMERTQQSNNVRELETARRTVRRVRSAYFPATMQTPDQVGMHATSRQGFPGGSIRASLPRENSFSNANTGRQENEIDLMDPANIPTSRHFVYDETIVESVEEIGVPHTDGGNMEHSEDPNTRSLLGHNNLVVQPNIYTASSYFCPAALLSGLIDDSTGGCLEYRMMPANPPGYGEISDGTFTSYKIGAFSKAMQIRSCGDGTYFASVHFGVEVCMIIFACIYCTLVVLIIKETMYMLISIFVVGNIHIVLFQQSTVKTLEGIILLPQACVLSTAFLIIVAKVFNEKHFLYQTIDGVTEFKLRNTRTQGVDSAHAEQEGNPGQPSSSRQPSAESNSDALHVDSRFHIDSQHNKAMVNVVRGVNKKINRTGSTALIQSLMGVDVPIYTLRLLVLIPFLTLVFIYDVFEEEVAIGSFNTNFADDIETEEESGKSVALTIIIHLIFALLGLRILYHLWRIYFSRSRGTGRLTREQETKTQQSESSPAQASQQESIQAGTEGQHEMSPEAENSQSANNAENNTDNHQKQDNTDSNQRHGIPSGLPSKQLLYLTGIFYAAFLVFHVVFLLLSKDKYAIHLHHAGVGLLMLPLAQIPNKSTAVWYGLGAGMFLDGYVKWGFEPNFSAKSDQVKPPKPTNFQYVALDQGQALASAFGNALAASMTTTTTARPLVDCNSMCFANTSIFDDDFTIDTSLVSNVTSVVTSTTTLSPVGTTTTTLPGGSFPPNGTSTSASVNSTGSDDDTASKLTSVTLDTLIVQIKGIPKDWDGVLFMVNQVVRGYIERTPDTEKDWSVMFEKGFTDDYPHYLTYVYVDWFRAGMKSPVFSLPSTTIQFTPAQPGR